MLGRLTASAALAAALCSGAALADEASVRKGVEAFIGTKVDEVRKTPYLDLYEITVEGQVFYTDEKVTHVLSGEIYEVKSRKNLTDERIRQISAIKFSDLPLELAVKQVRGNGKRKLATFEDPNCGYCKKLARDLAGIDDVTIYTFLYPILSPDSIEKSRNIWCAKDKAKAWNEWMINGATPASASCEAPTEKVVALGRKLRISGTPTIFLTSGERIPGAIPVAQLEEKLAAAAR